MTQETPRKILLLENDENDYINIKEKIWRRLGSKFQLFPQLNDRQHEDLNNWRYLLQNVNDRKFKEILEYYHNIDLFIIDNCLTTTWKDDMGMEIGNFILGNYPRENYKIIYISNYVTPRKKNMLGAESFFSKSDNRPFFEDALVKKITTLYHIPLPELNRSQLPIDQTTSAPPAKNSFSVLLRSYGISFTIQVVLQAIAKWVAGIIDLVIMAMFYILLFTTSIYGGVHIVEGFRTVPKEDGSGKYNVDSVILRQAEHIFLYLLPIFIVFGFMVYYKTNIRIYFKGGNASEIDENMSTRIMNLTKLLFISSLISYTLIKILEELFNKQNAGTDIFKLTAAGILLLMLMAYFIFLNNKKHS